VIDIIFSDTALLSLSVSFSENISERKKKKEGEVALESLGDPLRLFLCRSNRGK
jgi:hypothetical protein